MAIASIKIVGLRRITENFDKLTNIDMTPTVNKAVVVVKGYAKENVAKDTGDLSGSISSTVETKGKTITGKVFTNLEYAPYVEFGTGAKGQGTYPHPVKGLSLSYRQTPWGYIDPKTDEYIWTNGQVAQPFMYPALNENRTAIQRLIRKEHASQIAKLTK